MASNDLKNITKQKFRGALIGALVGDCYGAPFEGLHQVNSSTLMDAIEQMSKNKETLSYTDDTAMSISTCKSLIENKGLDVRHLAKEFSETYFKQPGRGYGPSVRTVFSALRDTNYQDPFGPASRQFDGKGSFGNGAAMRCVGIALFGHKQKLDRKRLIDISESCARVTHSHPHGINGATLLVLAVEHLLNLNENELDEMQFINDLIRIVKEFEPEGDRIYSKKLEQIIRVLENLSISGKDVSQSEIVRMLGNDVAAQNSVPLAIYSFLRGTSKFNDAYGIENEFTRTLHWAISCGGDTDTIASMACGLSGAYLSLHKIPENLYHNCESWLDIMSYADQICSDDFNDNCTTESNRDS